MSGRITKKQLRQDFANEIDSLSSSFNNLSDKVDIIENDLVSHKADEATLTQYGHVQHGIITTTVFAEDWEGNEAPYTNTVSAPSVLATDNPIVDVIDIDGSAQDAWGTIFRVVTSEGLIIFYALEKPDVDLQVQIKVVR